MLLLCSVLAGPVACSTFEKPDDEACFNLGVAGFGGCVTEQTNKQRVLSPEAWSAMKSGPGFWYMPEAVANKKKFLLKVCEKTKICKDADIAEINKKFDLFINAPNEILTPPAKKVPDAKKNP